MSKPKVPGRPERSQLPALAERINAEVHQAEVGQQDDAGHAIRAGELLREARALVRRGEWLPWLAANFSASERTARAYMRLAQPEASGAGGLPESLLGGQR